jgi:hypothetical protein
LQKPDGKTWLAKYAQAALGYRHMYWDYEEDGYIWDMTASDPHLDLGIRF